ncbi:hypothetical protein JZ751_009497 [Albula glossodonta]|uniref:Calsyntenin-3 n=1 Tax=Albula glossodonta TaxID=121402 RepID=A0A8T2P8K3_9TELE|nr:hypothetical protein JZ751_009497 [Albula glossodonta]
MAAPFMEELSDYLGSPEPAVRLIFSILIGYPFALVYRRYFFHQPPYIVHLFHTFSGLALAAFNFGSQLYHSAVCIVVQFLLLRLMGRTVTAVLSSFLFQMMYLLFGYYYTATDQYDIKWTMPHCVLALKLIGLSFDYYDGGKEASQLSAEQQKGALPSVPSLLEVLGFSYFYGGFLVGPQFTLRSYLKLTCGELTDCPGQPPNSVFPAMKRFSLGLVCLAIFTIGSPIYPDSYFLTDEYEAQPFWYRCFYILVWAKINLYKYVSCWVIAEGVCILSGLGYNGKDSNGVDQWDACANMRVWQYETTPLFTGTIASFNINTNAWAARHVFKRLKFLGNKMASQVATLVFLAIWHGLHSGYILCFSMEFIIVTVEKQALSLVKDSPMLTQLSNSSVYPLIYCVQQVIHWLFMGYPLVPFCLFTYDKWLKVYSSVYFCGHVFFFAAYLLMPYLRKALVPRKGGNEKKEEEINTGTAQRREREKDAVWAGRETEREWRRRGGRTRGETDAVKERNVGYQKLQANKHKPWIETEYQGIVMENDNTVLLNPPLFALDKDAPLHYAGEICGFRVHSGTSGSGAAQFEAVVLDRSTGEGLVRSKEPLDCESQREHSFTIQAYDCGEGPDGVNSKKSHKATVHVRVNDVNEFSPVFVERRYEASVPEGRLFDRIVRVEALDADCSPQYSQICFYDIITPNVPFAIDNDGNIKNTEPLDSKRQRVHSFWVTAFDCGKNRAQADAQVIVTVKPSCKPGWIGWSKRVEYTPGSGNIPLFPNLHLETCEETVWNIQATVELQTGHIGKGCDRDSYSDRSVRRLCGAVRGEVDLLPPPSPAANWTAALPTLPSSDSSLVFSFNGSTHVAVVPDSVAAAVSGDHFTLQLWMRRGGANIQPPANQARGSHREEETIICSTVKNDDSFSHYSLSVHGCRLSLFYWPDVATARPVKFLWKLEQVCDSEWHHLSLSVQFPSVTLYVDGVTFDPALIHDNGAIPSPAPRQRLVIGACWEPEEKQKDIVNNTIPESKDSGRYLGGYRGLLSGVTVRPGSVEPHSVVECLYACREGLDFGDLETLGSGMKVHVNPSQSVLVLEGDDIESFNRAMQQVTYRNSLRFATPGVRPLKLTTSLRCFSEEGCLSLRQLEGYLVVLQPDAPQISLSGVGPHLARPAPEFEGPHGVPLFPELRIVCSLTHTVNTAVQGMEGGALMSDAVAHTLDGCEVQPLGEELNPEREELLVDIDTLRERGLDIINTTAYIAITGAESISVYEDVLRSIRYRLAKGSARFERRFRLSCSEMNGRLYHPSHLLASQQQFLHPSHHSGELSGHTLPNPHRNSVVPGAATVIIMVCVGFLVVMVILGVFRIRSIHRRGDGARGGSKESSNQWDDSALTIIVNPMESYESRMGTSGDTEGECEEEEEVVDSPGDSSDDQRIIIKKEGRDNGPRRY